MENKLELLKKYQSASQLILLVHDKLIEIENGYGTHKGKALDEVKKVSGSFFLPRSVKEKKFDALVAQEAAYFEEITEFLRRSTELMLRCLREAELIGLVFLENEGKLTISK